jgi:hypothetical protein
MGSHGWRQIDAHRASRWTAALVVFGASMACQAEPSVGDQSPGGQVAKRGSSPWTVSNDGSTLAYVRSCRAGDCLYVRDLAAGRVQEIPTRNLAHASNTVAVSGNGRYVFYERVIPFRLGKGVLGHGDIVRFDRSTRKSLVLPLMSFPDGLLSHSVVSSNGRYLLTQPEEWFSKHRAVRPAPDELRVVDAVKRRFVRVSRPPKGRIYQGATLSSDGRRVVYRVMKSFGNYRDQRFSLFDRSSRRAKLLSRSSLDRPSVAAMSHDGSIVLTSGGLGQVTLFRRGPGGATAVGGSSVVGAAMNDAGTRVVVLCTDNAIAGSSPPHAIFTYSLTSGLWSHVASLPAGDIVFSLAIGGDDIFFEDQRAGVRRLPHPNAPETSTDIPIECTRPPSDY